MYLVHINPNMHKPCHDGGRCYTQQERDACISPKQVLLFEDGTFAYTHARQDVEKDGVVYQLQEATDETRHLVDRCHRKAVMADHIDGFGASLPIGDGKRKEGMCVLDFEGDASKFSKEASAETARGLGEAKGVIGLDREGWEEVEAPVESQGA